MTASARPAYWARAKRALAASDATLAGIIAEHPRVALASRGDAFSTLARSIVGQQISVKAAEAVWQRFNGALPEISPAAVLAAGEAGLAGDVPRVEIRPRLASGSILQRRQSRSCYSPNLS